MGSTRRSFTDGYKASAVAFVLDEGRPVVGVARNIDVHEMSLRKWVKKERDTREEALGPEAALSESERAELLRLRDDYKTVKAENAQLQMAMSTRQFMRQLTQVSTKPGAVHFDRSWRSRGRTVDHATPVTQNSRQALCGGVAVTIDWD